MFRYFRGQLSAQTAKSSVIRLDSPCCLFVALTASCRCFFLRFACTWVWVTSLVVGQLPYRITDTYVLRVSCVASFRLHELTPLSPLGLDLLILFPLLPNTPLPDCDCFCSSSVLAKIYYFLPVV